jgi:hypothetical protein
MGFFSKWFGTAVPKLTTIELNKLEFEHPLVLDVRQPAPTGECRAKLIPLVDA